MTAAQCQTPTKNLRWQIAPTLGYKPATLQRTDSGEVDASTTTVYQSESKPGTEDDGSSEGKAIVDEWHDVVDMNVNGVEYSVFLDCGSDVDIISEDVSKTFSPFHV